MGASVVATAGLLAAHEYIHPEIATSTDNFSTKDIEQAAKVLEKATKKLLKRNLIPEY